MNVKFFTTNVNIVERSTKKDVPAHNPERDIPLKYEELKIEITLTSSGNTSDVSNYEIIEKLESMINRKGLKFTIKK